MIYSALITLVALLITGITLLGESEQVMTQANTEITSIAQELGSLSSSYNECIEVSVQQAVSFQACLENKKTILENSFIQSLIKLEVDSLTSEQFKEVVYNDPTIQSRIKDLPMDKLQELDSKLEVSLAELGITVNEVAELPTTEQEITDLATNITK